MTARQIDYPQTVHLLETLLQTPTILIQQQLLKVKNYTGSYIVSGSFQRQISTSVCVCVRVGSVKVVRKCGRSELPAS